MEAVHLANLLCQFGYYFPVNEQKNLLVKDDSSLYRFQVRESRWGNRSRDREKLVEMGKHE